MIIFKRLKQAFIPVDQPTSFPRLYFIPETETIEAALQASNDAFYQQPAPTMPIKPARAKPIARTKEGYIQRFKRRQKEKLQRLCAEAWSATKAFGRSVVRWLAWRIFLPLSVMASFSATIVNPAELPL